MALKYVNDYVNEQTGATLKAKIQAAAASLFSANLGFPEVMPQSTFTYKLLLAYLDKRFCYADLERWGLEADSVLQGLLEKYKGIWESEAWEIDPLTNYSEDHTQSGSSSGTTTQTGAIVGSTSETENRKDQSSHSDTSQGQGHEGHTTAEQSQTDRMENRDLKVVTDDDKEHDETRKRSDTPQGAINGITNDRYLSDAEVVHGTDKDDSTVTTDDDLIAQDKRVASGSDSVNTDHVDIQTGQSAGQADSSRAGTSSQESNNVSERHEVTGGTDHHEGYAGISPQKLTQEYRDLLDTYTAQMIKECATLFVLCYDSDYIDALEI